MVLLSLGGCSFAAVRGPKHDRYDQRADPPESCTDSYLAPLADTVGAGVLAGLGTAVLTANHTEGRFTPDLSGVAAGMFLVPAALYVASAVYGYTTVHACRSPTAETIARDEPPPAPVTAGQLPVWLPLAAPNSHTRH